MHKDGRGLAWSRQEFIDVENTFPYLFINPCKTEIPWWLFFVFLFLFFSFCASASYQEENRHNRYKVAAQDNGWGEYVWYFSSAAGLLNVVTQRYETSQEISGGQKHPQGAFGLLLLPRRLRDPCLNLGRVYWFLQKKHKTFGCWKAETHGQQEDEVISCKMEGLYLHPGIQICFRWATRKHHNSEQKSCLFASRWVYKGPYLSDSLQRPACIYLRRKPCVFLLIK